jgi:multidrug efflux pump subunit AcrB
MDWLQLSLDRISMGSLVIALGLIPGNAILVVEDIKVRLDRGMAGVEAARKLMAEKAAPLLGATAVTVLAFAPMEGMGNGTGDYTRPLFLVILIALPLSWVSALTLAPLLADRFLKSNGEGYTSGDSFGHGFPRLYARTLDAAIRHRWSLLGATALLSALSIYGFGFVQQIYFPPSNSPGFLVEVYFRPGTHIQETERRADEIQAYLHSQEGVLQVATAIGAGHPRYLPGYRPEPDPGSNYAASLTSVDDPRRIDAMGPRIQAGLEARFPDAVVNVERQARAMDSAGGAIQLRIGGPDPAKLRHLADRAKAVIAADPDAKAVRDDWGAKVKVARPVLDGELARRLHIDRAQITSALRTAYSGSSTGFYREGSQLVPIVVRAPKDERSKVEDMGDIQVTSPLRGDRISLDRLVERLDTVTEDSRRSRRDGMAVITVHADADRGSAFELLARIKPQAEQVLGIDSAANESADPRSTLEIPLKGNPGYFIAWGGEAESLAESRAGLWTWLPYCFGLIVLALIALFNGLRQPLIVLLTAPLSLIGAAAGLLLTGRPFDFMSLLGLLGLSGILMRNATLLAKGIDSEMRADPTRPSAIREAATKHLRPLALAAGTSALTLLPLLQDDLFRSMAMTLLFGLAIAIMLALVLVPVLYSVLFPIRSGESP